MPKSLAISNPTRWRFEVVARSQLRFLRSFSTDLEAIRLRFCGALCEIKSQRFYCDLQSRRFEIAVIAILRANRHVEFKGSSNRGLPPPLGCGVCETKSEKGPQDTNPSCIGFTLLRGGLRPWSQPMVSARARPWGRSRPEFAKRGDCGSEKLLESVGKF